MGTDAKPETGQPPRLFGSSSSRAHLLLVFAAAACLFFIKLGSLALVEPDEGRNAEVAREILVSGDWITPHLDTLPYLDKPALFFWLVAGSMRLWGMSEWAARLPSALAALATTIIVWMLARRVFQEPGQAVADRNTGEAAADVKSPRPGALLAAIVFATSPLVTIFAREVIFDMTLTFLVSLALLWFWRAASDLPAGAGLEQLWPNVGFFGSMGLATFVKGPVGFVLPLLVVVLYQALRGRLRELKRLRWGLGGAIFAVTALPWYVVVSLRNPAFPHYALWEETFQRFLGGHFHRSASLLYYLPVFLAGFFPWSLCLFFGAWNRLRRWKALKQEDHKAELFLLVWAAAIFLFFTIVRSKLPGYILPAAVPLAILMARLWADVGSARWPRPPDWLTACFAIVLALGILTAASPQLLRFAGLRLPARKIPPNVAPFINPGLFFSGVMLAAIGVLGRSLGHRLSSRAYSMASFVLLALTFPLLLLRWATPLKAFAEARSSRALARLILETPEKGMPIYGYYYFRTSLPFYLRSPVGLVTSGGSETTSNYVVSQFQALRQYTMPFRWQPSAQASTTPPTPPPAKDAGADHRLSSGPTQESPQSAPPQTGQQITIVDRASAPLLIDPHELQGLARSSPIPFLVMVRNRLVPDAVQGVGAVQPLWSAWDYSVLEVPAAGRKPGEEYAPVMIDGIVRPRRSP